MLAGGAATDAGVGFYTRPHTRGGVPDADAISSASGAYVGKRASTRPARQMSAQANRMVKLTPNAKTFYPEDYYKRVGYQKSETSSHARARVDALGQRVRDRFNEDLDSDYQQRKSGGLHHRTLKQLKQAHKAGGPASQASRVSDVFTQNKRRSQVAAVSQSQSALGGRCDEDAGDAQSIITVERLKRFNEVHGTVAGNQTDELAAKEAAVEFPEADVEPAHGEEGCA